MLQVPGAIPRNERFTQPRVQFFNNIKEFHACCILCSAFEQKKSVFKSLIINLVKIVGICIF